MTTLINKHGDEFTPQNELQRAALLHLGYHEQEPDPLPNLVKTPLGWLIFPVDGGAPDHVTLPEPRKPNWLGYLFGLFFFVAALVIVGLLVRAFVSWWIGGGR